MFSAQEHFRDYPYRNPLPKQEKMMTDWPLYFRFIRAYVWPHRAILAVCLLITAVNVNYMYVVNFLSRLTVDNILVIGEPPAAPQKQEQYLVARPDKDSLRQPSRPESGLGRNIDWGYTSLRRPPEAGRKLFWICVAYILTQCFFNTLGRLSSRCIIICAQGIMGSLREDMHKKVMELSLSYHQAMNPGRLLSRILSDVESAQAEMLTLLVGGFGNTVIMIVGLAIMILSDWRMALLVICIMPIYSWLFSKKRPRIRAINREQSHTNACMYGLVSQKIDAIKAIQSYGQEKHEALAFHRLAATFFHDAMSVQWLAMVLHVQASTLVHLCNCTIFLFGGYLVVKGEMTLGRMIFLHSTASVLFQPTLEFTNLAFVIQRLRISLLRIASVLDQKPEIAEDPNSQLFPTPIRQGVEVRHLSFSYNTAGYSREVDEDRTDFIPPPPVLKDISFFVPAGTWLCIMGASGCGKTTLLHLLARLYEPSSGNILIDGIDLNNFNLASLRHSLGVVPQEAQIFGGTIRDNIAYGKPNATNEEIMEAAKAAQMHDFILDMKVQYETIVGQKGNSLSGGQRQRLSLARALLTNPELLLLDDCTSALDANTERKIQETLAHILVGKTAIMVSQRISMAMRCHKICVLENGVISEFGTHQELLANHGFYAKLYAQQTGQNTEGNA